MHDRRGVVGGLVLLPMLAPAACGSEPFGSPAKAQEPRRLRPVSGCEGCEAVWEREQRTLAPVLTLAGPDEPGERLTVTGTVFRARAQVPAANVVVYVHHTNAVGRYADGTNESKWSRRHGRLRGWLKTGIDGRYEIRTIKPAPYPGRTGPAHIHFFILQPGRSDPYWIDDLVFAGEFGVNAPYRRERENRGGSGVVQLISSPGEGLTARRDIVLSY